MPIRPHPIEEAIRRSHQATVALGAELRSGRRACGLSQAEVARALRWSPSRIGRIERGERVSAAHAELAGFAAAVGLTYSGRLFVGETRLRDAGQLKMISGYRSMVTRWGWSCRIEEPLPITGDLPRALRRAATSHDATTAHPPRPANAGRRTRSRWRYRQGQVEGPTASRDPGPACGGRRSCDAWRRGRR